MEPTTLDLDQLPEPVAHPVPASRVQIALRALAGVTLGAGLLVAAVWLFDVKVDALVAQLTQISPWAVAACIGSAYVIIALQALRWRTTMFPLLGVSFFTALRVQLVVAMLNAIPPRAGDLLKIEYFSRRTGIPRAKILGNEIVDRWLDFWGWMPTFLFVCLLGSPPSWLVKTLGFFGSVLVAWAIAMVVLSRRGWSPNPASRVGRLWGALRSGLDAFRSPRIAWIALLLAPLPWLWETWFIAQIAHAFGFELSMIASFSVLMAFNLAMAVPSPAGAGTIEAAGLGALQFFGVEPAKALAFMVAYHLAGQLIPSIGGGIGVLAFGGKEIMRKSPAARPTVLEPTPEARAA